MGIYYEADQSVYEIMDSLIYERFGDLRPATIKILMYSKPKIDKFRGIMTFASIKTANEVERFLSKDGHHIEGTDYLMFINDLVWELAGDQDKHRIISHELRHCFIDEKGNFKIIRHDIEDFYAEVRINEDDPMWGQALSTVAMAKYEQMKAEEKATR
ncbi:MAG: putative metallopeptidase [Candidatus Hodarchaeales archaeon]|jgi:hypothetical protein